MRYTLIDGEARSAEHPDTFEVPPWEERAFLQAGDLAKVGAEFDPEEPQLNVDSVVRPAFEEKFGQAWGERFWVLINDVRDGVYHGEVNNELGYTRHHGLYLGRPSGLNPGTCWPSGAMTAKLPRAPEFYPRNTRILPSLSHLDRTRREQTGE